MYLQVPKTAQNYPKFPKNGHFFTTMPLNMYNCISKNPAFMHNIQKHSYKYFFGNLGTQNEPHFVKIWPKNASFCILCMLKHENW